MQYFSVKTKSYLTSAILSLCFLNCAKVSTSSSEGDPASPKPQQVKLGDEIKLDQDFVKTTNADGSTTYIVAADYQLELAEESNTEFETTSFTRTCISGGKTSVGPLLSISSNGGAGLLTFDLAISDDIQHQNQNQNEVKLPKGVHNLQISAVSDAPCHLTLSMMVKKADEINPPQPPAPPAPTPGPGSFAWGMNELVGSWSATAGVIKINGVERVAKGVYFDFFVSNGNFKLDYGVCGSSSYCSSGRDVFGTISGRVVNNTLSMKCYDGASYVDKSIGQIAEGQLFIWAPSFSDDCPNYRKKLTISMSQNDKLQFQAADLFNSDKIDASAEMGKN